MRTPFPHLSPWLRGRVAAIDHASQALRANPWGDPAHRDLWVWTPPGYGRDPAARLPAVLVLPGFGETGEGLLARRLDSPGLHTRFDHLLAATDCPPFIAVFPDVASTLGGTQYVDSPGIGDYARWLALEVLPFVDGRFRTNGRWAVVGASSGGFGALHLALRFPGRFDAVGAVAPDMGFDLTVLDAISAGLGPITAAGGPRAFLDAYWAVPRAPDAHFMALYLLCLSAAYGDGTPEADGFPGPLPVDPATGALRPAVLARWAAFDPLVRIEEPAAQDALRSLRVLALTAGDRDEHHLHLPLRRFAARAAALGLPVTHAEFAGGHRGTAPHLAALVPALVRPLADAGPGAAGLGPAR